MLKKIQRYINLGHGFEQNEVEDNSWITLHEETNIGKEQFEEPI